MTIDDQSLPVIRAQAGECFSVLSCHRIAFSASVEADQGEALS
ncbi:hypothetical protein [Mycolicibacterium sp. HK-90]|nr:hypothetical protein [Mycolicibacterium sp. HK-90]WKG02807.1 hypothetical protein QU592_27040 [Mycolicibacterium sp. HK-90]